MINALGSQTVSMIYWGFWTKFCKQGGNHYRVFACVRKTASWHFKELTGRVKDCRRQLGGFCTSSGEWQGSDTGLWEWNRRDSHEMEGLADWLIAYVLGAVRTGLHRRRLPCLELPNGGAFIRDGKGQGGDMHSVLDTLGWRDHWADPEGNKTLRDTSSTFHFVDKSIEYVIVESLLFAKRRTWVLAASGFMFQEVP